MKSPPASPADQGPASTTRFPGKLTSCLVNPRGLPRDGAALHRPPPRPSASRVVGRGRRGHGDRRSPPAERGQPCHALGKRAGQVGGQLNMAKTIPGKEEFVGLVDWFATMLDPTRRRVASGRGAVLYDDLRGHDEIITRHRRPRPRGSPVSRDSDGTERLELCRRAGRQGARGGGRVAIVGGGWASASTLPSSLPTRVKARPRCPTSGAVNGGWRTPPSTAEGSRPKGRSRIPRRARWFCSSARRKKARQTAGQDDRLDSPREPEDEGA